MIRTEQEHPPLERRMLNIIKLLVDEYLSKGAPVSSKTLAAKQGINLSPASVRSVMANLERMGFIEPVHTSSGRYPTVKGMRVYISSLLKMQQPSQGVRDELANSLRTESTDAMAQSAIDSVAMLTKMVALVSIPGTSNAKIAQIQFVKLASTRVMAVLVTMDGEVHNRLIEVSTETSVRDLEIAAQVFNERFVGHTLAAAKLELRGLMVTLQERIAALLQKMITTITSPTGPDTQPQVYMSSPENLYANAELVTDAKHLKELVDLLHRKEVLLSMLERGISAANVSVFIGSESGIPELDDCSLVTAPYEDDDGKVIGALGLIGPIRMKYASIVPIIEVTSTLMGAALAKIRKDFN